MMPTNSPSYS